MIAVILIANLNIVVGLISPSPIAYHNSPFPVLNTEPIGPRDGLRLEVNRCNTSNEPIIVVTTRTLVNIDSGDTESFPPVSSIIPPGCSIYYPIIAPLEPLPYIPSGRYHYEAITSVTTVFRTYNIVWETQEFVYHKD